MFIDKIREPFAVLVDIHGNLEAFQVVLNHVKAQNITKILYLGDIIGYGANPHECLALARENGLALIKGNHERFITKEVKPSAKEVTSDLPQAIKWTRKQMSREEIKYIKQLPDDLNVGVNFQFVHGSPRDKDEYIITYEAVKINLDWFIKKYPNRHICFFGHSHLPCIVGRETGRNKIHKTHRESLAKGESYLINPGSVGQPRDKSPDAAYAVFDPGSWEVTIFRLPYNVTAAMKKIVAAGLPMRFAERLKGGT